MADKTNVDWVIVVQLCQVQKVDVFDVGKRTGHVSVRLDTQHFHVVVPFLGSPQINIFVTSKLKKYGSEQFQLQHYVRYKQTPSFWN